MRKNIQEILFSLVVAGFCLGLPSACSSESNKGSSCPMTCSYMPNGHDCSCTTGEAFACECKFDRTVPGSGVSGINWCVDGCYGRCMFGDRHCADDGPDNGLADPCPEGLTDCGDCVQLSTSTQNCGACGHACVAGRETCMNSICCPYNSYEMNGTCYANP